MLNMAY
jgi:hypothetical protein